MGAVINKIAFQPPHCSYGKNLEGLLFITKYDSNTSICAEPKIVSIPIREYFIDHNLPTVLWCHGNAIDIGMLDMSYISSVLNANIVSFDYAAYGLHSKKHPSEQDCYDDVTTVYYQYLLPKVKDPTKITILGHSLGSAIACHLAYTTRYDKVQPANLILISGLYSATTIKTWLPLPFIDCFQNYKLAPFIKSAVSIYHSEVDEVIPFACARELALKFKNLVRLRSTYALSHNDTLNDPGVFQSIRMQIH